jgi:hypothetical protein
VVHADLFGDPPLAQAGKAAQIPELLAELSVRDASESGASVGASFSHWHALKDARGDPSRDHRRLIDESTDCR